MERDGEGRRGTVSRQWNQKLLFLLPQLGLTVSLLIGWDVGTSMEEATAILNQFSVEDLRFKDLKQWYFSAARVFRLSLMRICLIIKLIKRSAEIKFE